MRRCRVTAHIIGVCTSASVLAPTATEASTCDRATFKIVLDVGHSAQAPGATSARGISEFDFNLRLSSVIEAKLIERGYKLVFRIISSGRNHTLATRAARANSLHPDLFLSVHHDSVQAIYLKNWIFGNRRLAYSDRFSGWSLLVSMDNKYSTSSLHFAQVFADQLLAHNLPFTRHHSEAITGEGKSFLDAGRGIYRDDGLAVLRETLAPAVLFEAGVIINRREEAALSSSQRQSIIAESAANAIDDFCANHD